MIETETAVRGITKDGEPVELVWTDEHDRMTTADLIDEAIRVLSIAKAADRHLGILNHRILGAMQDDEATETLGRIGKAQLSTRTGRYDPDRLDSILEYVPREELIEAGALIPEREVVQPRRWNATHLRAFGKRGKAIREVIESARVGVQSTVKLIEFPNEVGQ